MVVTRLTPPPAPHHHHHHHPNPLLVRKRVETLFNPLENFIEAEGNKKQRLPKSKPSLELKPLATITETSPDATRNRDLSDSEQDQPQSANKEQEKKVPSSEKNCVICKRKHPVAFCPPIKSNHLQERKKIAWHHGLCFNAWRQTTKPGIVRV